MWRKNIDITLVKIYNKRNVYEKKDRVDEVGGNPGYDMKKKDLKHLSRRELVDLICEMEKTNLLVDVQALEEAKEEQRRLKDRSAYRQTFRGTVAVLLVAAAVAVLVATLWMPVLQIYGASMSPTLEAGQIVISVKNNQLKTGQIVAFWQGNKLLIKRVIAGPGQWVDIDENGIVTVDGQTLEEPYLNGQALGNCDIELPHQVAEAHWFLMGDNRDTSVDSRTASIGDISMDQIEGQIVFRIWPLDQMGRLDQ